jgi:hypothetical protein
MLSDATSEDLKRLEEESRESIEKVRKMVEDHEGTIHKDKSEPPLFYRQD